VQVLQLTALLAIAQFASLAISTNAIVSTPPHASARLPLDVVAMLRTTPPPEGIGHRSNFSLLGSKRTSMLGDIADSAYQIPRSSSSRNEGRPCTLSA